MEIGISTLLFPKSKPEDCIEIAGEMDLEYIELFLDLPHFPPEINKKRIVEIKETIKSHGLKSRLHGRLWDLNPLSQYREIRKLSLERAKESIRTCRSLNGDLVTLHPGKCWVREEDRPSKTCKEWFGEYIEKLLKYANRKDIKLAIETGSHEAEYPSSLQDFLEVTKEREKIGVTLDTGHSFLYDQEKGIDHSERIANMIEKLNGKLKNVHIHDNDGHSDLHLPPDSGEINFKLIIKALKKHYEGPLILELWDPINPRKTARKGITNLRRLLSRY